MGQTANEPDLTPLILKLIKDGVKEKELDERIIEFFGAYDESKAKQISRLQ